MDGIQCGYSAATADPFASVGMTRGERRLRLKLLLEGETHTAAEAVPLEEKSARSGTKQSRRDGTSAVVG